MKDILEQDKEESTHYNDEIYTRKYTVEDIIKIGSQLNENNKENKNAKLDLEALKNKVENLEKKLNNATEYLDEIESHKKSIFEFWKYANKDESKMLAEGDEEEKEEKQVLKKTFDYEEDIEDFANQIDTKQREELSEQELDAIFASNFVLDGINIVSKNKLLKKDQEKISNILEELKQEYKKDIEKIEKKDFDILETLVKTKQK